MIFLNDLAEFIGVVLTGVFRDPIVAASIFARKTAAGPESAARRPV
jgi:hypothetical protein